MKNNRDVNIETHGDAGKKPVDVSLVVRIVAISVLAALVVSLSSIFIACADNFNYLTSDLSAYLTISPDDYKEYEVDLSKLKDVTDADVEFEIMKTLAAKKDSVPLYSGIGYKSIEMENGDVVYINYYGYKLDSEGRKIPVTAGMTNITASASSLALGSGSMIPGFEYGLVGKNPEDYARLVKRTSGVINDGDIIYVTFTAAYPDGTSKSSVTERIDLSKGVDDIYGEGFKEFIVGKNIGKITFTKDDGSTSNSGLFELSEGTVAYTSMTVNFAADTEKEKAPLTVDVYFPHDYSSAELQGVECKFDIYVDRIIQYDTPSLTDEFVKDTLKMEDTVSEYEGQTLSEKYRAYVRKTLVDEVEAAKKALKEDAMWQTFVSKATFYKLPQKKVTKHYNELYNQLKETYESNADMYDSYYGIKSFESYVRAATGVNDKTVSIESIIRDSAEKSVKELLVFYYVLRNENMVMNEQEYSALYEDVLDTYVEAYAEQNSIVRDNYQSDEAYNNAMADVRIKVVEIIGEETMQHNTYFDHCIDIFLSWAKEK